MQIFEIQNSSAISKIEFNPEECIVGICYTSSQKKYEFLCDDIEFVKQKIQLAITNDESIGKLINSFRKDGVFQPILIES